MILMILFLNQLLQLQTLHATQRMPVNELPWQAEVPAVDDDEEGFNVDEEKRTLEEEDAFHKEDDKPQETIPDHDNIAPIPSLTPSPTLASTTTPTPPPSSSSSPPTPPSTTQARFISQEGLEEQGWRAQAHADKVPEGTVVMHIIAHTHCDPGWLQTFEDYYTSAVRSILDSVVIALEANEQRRFNWVEICYLERWWRERDASWHERLRTLWKKYERIS